MLFTVDVQYTGSIEHAQASPTSSTEQPTCPVCLGMQVFVCVCVWIHSFDLHSALDECL